jgi:hypothetical protein
MKQFCVLEITNMESVRQHNILCGKFNAVLAEITKRNGSFSCVIIAS